MRHLPLAWVLLVISNLYAQTSGEFSRQAQELIRRYQWEEAAQLLGKGLHTYPESASLLLRLGALRTQMGSPTEGEALLKKALTLQPVNPEAWHQIGEAQLRQGQSASAVDSFRKAIHLDPANPRHHYRLAYALFTRGEEQAALKSAKEATRLKSDSPAILRLYAVLLHCTGDQRESSQQLRQAHILAPGDARLLFQLSEERRLKKQWSQALEYLELAAVADPENPLYYERLGAVYQQLEEPQAAREQQQRAERLGKAFEDYAWALLLWRRGFVSEAVRDLKQTVQLNPEFVTGKMLLANLLQQLGNKQESLELYLQILDQDPSQAAAREQGAWIRVEDGLLDSALDLLKGAQVTSPNQALVEGYRGLVREDWEGALEQFRIAEAANPLTPSLLKLVSLCLQELGRTKEALAYLEKVQRLQPDDPTIQEQILGIKLETGIHRMEAREWKAALEIFEPAIEKGSADSNTYLRSAYCYQQLNQLRRAVRLYRVGLASDPAAAWARTNLAGCLSRLRRHQEAAEEWQEIVGESRTPEAYLQLGLSYSHLQRFPESEEALRQARELGNDSPRLIYHLGLAKLHNHRLEEAWDLIHRAARAGFEPAIEMTRKGARWTETKGRGRARARVKTD